jgi:hypothetical protein
MTTPTKPSPTAARRMLLALDDWEELEGETDCPEGCHVEPDGVCPHGYLSAGRTGGVI